MDALRILIDGEKRIWLKTLTERGKTSTISTASAGSNIGLVESSDGEGKISDHARSFRPFFSR